MAAAATAAATGAAGDGTAGADRFPLLLLLLEGPRDADGEIGRLFRAAGDASGDDVAAVVVEAAAEALWVAIAGLAAATW